MRELPFSNIRDSNFKNTLNLDSVLRQELTIVKYKFRDLNSAFNAKVYERAQNVKLVEAENKIVKQHYDHLQATSSNEISRLQNQLQIQNSGFRYTDEQVHHYEDQIRVLN